MEEGPRSPWPLIPARRRYPTCLEAMMGKAGNLRGRELVQASTEAEVIEKVQAHVKVKHPDLIGNLTVSDTGHGGRGLRPLRRGQGPTPGRAVRRALYPA